MEESLQVIARSARAQIASGALRGAALLELLLSIPFLERDTFADAVLGIDPPPPDMPDLPRGSVPYLPSGVDEILAMLRDVPVGPSDVLVDLGSGLGRVLILTHLLTGARARGIGIQDHLVRSAKDRCAALRLEEVTFVHANAAEAATADTGTQVEADLDGSVFFLYAPCNGEMLTRLLARLERVARRRPIVVCTVGLELRDVEWLTPRRTTTVSLTLYDSVMK